MSRMNGKQCGDHQRGPVATGHPSKNGEDKQRIGKMENDIDHMMPARLNTEYRNVQSVRDPRQRMPISTPIARKRPANERQVEALPYVIVLVNVQIVVKIDKTKM